MARMNLGVQVPFEPGSIFKIMTVSAALETTNLTAGFAHQLHGRRASPARPRDS